MLSGCPEQLAMFDMKGFRLKQTCTGSETNLTECEIHIIGDNEHCYCGEVAEIFCQSAGKNAGSIKLEFVTTIFNTVNMTQTPTTTSTITTTDNVSPTTTSQDDNTTSINNTVLGAVIGVLAALVAVVLITIVCIVVVYMCKKRSAVHQQRYFNQ